MIIFAIDETAGPSTFLARIDEIVEIAEALGRLRHPHLDALLSQQGRGLVDRLAGSVVVLAKHDDLDDVRRELDVSEAADAEDRDAGQAGSLHGARDGFDAFADEQGRAGLDIVGQKDDAAFVGPEGAALIFFVDRGLAFAVGGKIRDLK